MYAALFVSVLGMLWLADHCFRTDGKVVGLLIFLT